LLSSRSLVAAAEEAAADRLRHNQAERAVLVFVEFTGERRKLTSAARQARRSALVAAQLEDVPGGTQDVAGG
jgi:GTP-binding protein HflX